LHSNLLSDRNPGTIAKEKLSTVLVTGGSGFVGSHCIVQLLAASHQVHTTVRDLKREGEVRAMLQEGGAVPGERLSFIAANLGNDKGWPKAIAGCEYVLHVASPLPMNIPKNEDELIVPAREGRSACCAPHAKPASSGWF
jgi:nucleoside-diphosphate-sugar epimerase